MSGLSLRCIVRLIIISKLLYKENLSEEHEDSLDKLECERLIVTVYLGERFVDMLVQRALSMTDPAA